MLDWRNKPRVYVERKSIIKEEEDYSRSEDYNAGISSNNLSREAGPTHSAMKDFHARSRLPYRLLNTNRSQSTDSINPNVRLLGVNHTASQSSSTQKLSQDDN